MIALSANNSTLNVYENDLKKVFFVEVYFLALANQFG
jgi:hypothetical protein